MELQNRVALRAVVEALNVEPPTPQEQVRFAERYAAAAGDLPRKETRPFAAAWLSHKLRSYVDAWLQTGRDAKGREFSWKRQLSGAGYWDVAEYLQQSPPSVSVSPEAGLTGVVGEDI